MRIESTHPRQLNRGWLRLLQSGVLSAFLAGIFSVAINAPLAASAAGTSTVATSTSSQAFQRSAEDRTAYLHDGSLLVGYGDPKTPFGAHIDHVTNPSTTPVSTEVLFIGGGDEVSIYTLPGVSSTEIWIQVGSELDGLPLLQQVQHGTYNGSTFTWDTLTQIPGALTTGRQDPSLTWTGKWLISSWWDDTMGGNSDNVFYNWTTDHTGAGPWAVTAKSGTVASSLAIKHGTTSAALTIENGTTAATTVAPTSTITYTPSDATTPAVGDWFEFGTGTPNSEVDMVSSVSAGPAPYTLTLATALAKPHNMGEADTTATTITYTAGTGGAPTVGDMFEFGNGLGTSETRTVTAISGSAPYVLTVAALTNSHSASEADTTATRISYTTTGAAPAVGDWFQIGKGNNCPCDAELRQVAAVSGTGPYILSVAALSSAHPAGEQIRAEALELSTTLHNSIQVSMRHSAKLGATIAVYGSHCRILTRTLLDSAPDPSPANWSTESVVDSTDDCENNFGGPQIAIDESNGNIHVFKAVTHSQGDTSWGVTYWLGHMGGGGAITWNPRVVIDSAATTLDPPDIAGAVDSTGNVYVFWATSVSGGSIKFVTLVSPYLAANVSPEITVPTTGTNPRYPHIPAQAPLTGGYVPLFYESGATSINPTTGIGTCSTPCSIILDTRYPDSTPPSVPTGLAGSTATKAQVTLTWNASTDNTAVAGYSIYRNGSLTPLATVSGATLTYTDTTVSDITSYTYSVDAFDPSGNHSAKSPTINVTTPDWTAPTVPTNLTATFLQTPEVDLAWHASSDNVAVTGYTIYRDGTSLTTVSGTTLAYADKAIAVPANYSYTVDAFDAAGNHSAQSAAAGVGTVDTMPPSVPSGVTASVTSTQAHVAWNASTDNVGVTGYTVYRNGSPLTSVSGSTLSYNDTTIGGLTTYSYTVDAFDAAGNHSAQSAAAVVTTVACAGPTLFTSYFNWYDKASPGVTADTIHLVNSGGTVSTGCVTIAGHPALPFSVDPGHDSYVSFPQGTIGGPAVVTVNSGPAVIASLRAWYYQSFNEILARPASAAATTQYFPWYDLASPGMIADAIHITNVSGTTATGTIALHGAVTLNFSVLNGQDLYYEFPSGTIGGPVTVTSSQPVLASLRAWYYQSFNETPARPASAAATTAYFPWYDLASPGMVADAIHITNVSGTTATGTIALHGETTLNFSVPTGQDLYFEFPSGTIGGPVTISSSQPVLASLRAWYYQSFNETAARSATAAASTQYFAWYDLASPGMRADTIHITNVSGSTATGTIALGANTIPFSVPNGQDLYFTFPPGSIGGPITITSDHPVLASLRAWFYQSFNEVPGSS